MNLKSPAFEKTLRRLVRQEVRRSPALKRERKRIGRKRRTTSSAAFWLSLAFLAFLFLFASFSRSPELAGGLLAMRSSAAAVRASAEAAAFGARAFAA